MYYNDTLFVSYKLKDYSLKYPDTLIAKYLFTTLQGDSFYSFENKYIIPDSNYFSVHEKIPITKNIIFPDIGFKILSFIKNEDVDTQNLKCWLVYPEIDSLYMISLAPEGTLKPGDSVALVPIFKNPTQKKIRNDSLFVWIELRGGEYGLLQRKFILAKGWVDSVGHRDTVIFKVVEYDLVIPPIYMGYCYGGYWIGKFKS
ncbi:MAG: hypothetical protein ABDH49_09305, partial [Candidatus Hydrothermales bacterium]